MAAFIDRTGIRYGRLVAIERAECPIRFAHPKHKFAIWWRCRCDCGTEKTVIAHALHRGDTKSCGCLRREMAFVLHESRKYPLSENDLIAIRRRLLDGGAVWRIAKDFHTSKHRIEAIKDKMTAFLMGVAA